MCLTKRHQFYNNLSGFRVLIHIITEPIIYHITYIFKKETTNNCLVFILIHFQLEYVYKLLYLLYYLSQYYFVVATWRQTRTHYNNCVNWVCIFSLVSPRSYSKSNFSNSDNLICHLNC